MTKCLSQPANFRLTVKTSKYPWPGTIRNCKANLGMYWTHAERSDPIRASRLMINEESPALLADPGRVCPRAVTFRDRASRLRQFPMVACGHIQSPVAASTRTGLSRDSAAEGEWDARGAMPKDHHRVQPLNPQVTRPLTTPTARPRHQDQLWGVFGASGHRPSVTATVSHRWLQPRKTSP